MYSFSFSVKFELPSKINQVFHVFMIASLLTGGTALLSKPVAVESNPSQMSTSQRIEYLQQLIFFPPGSISTFPGEGKNVSGLTLA